MSRICNSLAHRATSHISGRVLLVAFALMALISFSALTFAQDSFMIGVSPMTLGGTLVQRGDFNADGIPDIIVAVNGGTSSPAVSVFLGKGDGTFQTSLGSGTGVGAWDMAVGDFNGDGKLDVAVGGYTGSNIQPVIQILLGNGDGTFSNGQTIDVSAIPLSITTGDFNGDGKLDLAIATDKAYFFQGAGNGTFTANASVKVGTQSTLYQVVVGDFNGDGKADVAVSDGFKVYVLYDTGSFAFTTVQVASYVSAAYIAAVDVNQDHYTDLLTTYYTCTQQGSYACPAWQVLLGVKGQQSMKTGYTLPPSTTFYSFPNATAADINGDGFTDIVVNTRSFEMAVWLGNPDGTYQATPLTYNTGTESSNTDIVAVDLNRDGKIDFAIPHVGDGTLMVLLNATPQATTCAAGTVSPSITECMPVNNTYLNSLLRVTAKTTDTAHTVTTMQLYLNNALALSQAGNFLNYGATEPDGNYFVVTKAWDSSGASFRTDRNISIYTGTPGETCPTNANAINICSPTQSQTTTTSLHVFANSASTYPITAVQVYIDGTLVYNDTSQSTYVDSTFSVAAGSHSVVVKAFDSHGTVFSASRTIKAQ
jgi:hypothetical protein